MRFLTLIGLLITISIAVAQPVIQIQHYGWNNGRTRNFRVGGFSTSVYDVTSGTGKTWTFTVPTGSSYQNTNFVTVSGNSTWPTANLRMDYTQYLIGTLSSGSCYLFVGDSDIYSLGYTGAPNTIWNPAIPNGMPHRLNKTWQGNYSYGSGTYNIVGTVISSGTSTSHYGTFPTLLVRYNYSSGTFSYQAYQWETQEYGIIAQANTLNGGMLYVLNEATPNTGIDEIQFSLPEAISLGSPYPNPANGSVTVPISLPHNLSMQVKVVDLLGREVLTLSRGNIAAGNHSFSFGTDRLASGNYLISVQSNQQQWVQPLTVVK